MRQSSVVGAQRARPAFPRVQKTLAEGADRNARCARRREKGCSEHESNRNCQTDRRPRARRYPEGDTPHNADTGGRPDADNIDTRCQICSCFDGFIQENRTGVKKTAYLPHCVRINQYVLRFLRGLCRSNRSAFVNWLQHFCELFDRYLDKRRFWHYNYVLLYILRRQCFGTGTKGSKGSDRRYCKAL